MADGSNLVCDEVVRVIPNKRLVCKGIWQQKPVYAKLFIAGNARSYAIRDEVGVKYLLAANIKTPNLLYSGEVSEIKGYALIFEAIENAQNAEEIWTGLNTNARSSLAKKLVLELAKHHNAGLLQTDMYLKNFLVDSDTIYTLDGDGIRKYAGLSQQQALKNLCVLLSKFDVLEIESWLPGLLKTYSEARTWQMAPDIAQIKKMMNAHRQKVASNYAEKKVFRQCTDVAVSSSSKIFTAISSEFLDLDLPQTSQKLDSLVTSKNLLKNGNTCTVAKVEINHRPIVIKRYNIKNFWHGVSRALRQTRAAASWANAHRLKLLDIPTAKPVALIEERYLSLGKWGLKGKAYFLCEYIDAPDAAQFFAECTDKNARSEAVKNIVTLFYKLYLLRISHGDTKASNIKIVNNKPVLIDLDSMAQHNFSFSALKAHARDLRRFMENWKQTPAMYNAFVKAFKVVYTDKAALKLAKISE
ncbi:MAG: lipopolysaccharide kinase InaA family protein [Methylotenera sp.]